MTERTMYPIHQNAQGGCINIHNNGKTCHQSIERGYFRLLNCTKSKILSCNLLDGCVWYYNLKMFIQWSFTFFPRPVHLVWKELNLSSCRFGAPSYRVWLLTSCYSTHLSRDKMAAIVADCNFKCIFLMKMFEFLLILHCSMFLRVQLTITQHWFR